MEQVALFDTASERRSRDAMASASAIRILARLLGGFDVPPALRLWNAMALSWRDKLALLRDAWRLPALGMLTPFLRGPFGA